MSAHIYQYFDIWFLSWYNTDMVKVHLSWAERRNSSNLRKWLKIEILIVLTWYPKKSRNSEYDNFETEISFESPQKAFISPKVYISNMLHMNFWFWPSITLTDSDTKFELFLSNRIIHKLIFAAIWTALTKIWYAHSVTNLEKDLVIELW